MPNDDTNNEMTTSKTSFFMGNLHFLLSNRHDLKIFGPEGHRLILNTEIKIET